MPSRPVDGAVRHVLLDADGVLQLAPRDPLAILRPWAGDDADALLRALWAAEPPTLRGDADFLDAVDDVVPRFTDVDPRRVYDALWGAIEVPAASGRLVADLRSLGLGVHLGTNQHAQRAGLMRSTLGYDALFDVACYSCELGVAKPDPAFFERAVAAIGAPPHEVLFVDDLAPNVEAARTAGLPAHTWHLDDGSVALRKALAAHGVHLPD